MLKCRCSLLYAEFVALGHTYTRIDGTMSMQERINAMEAFDSERCDSMRTPRFILCSLHACGTGINLTRGNVVFMMDCWWNVAAENQAMDRVHRIGQKRPVRAIRFLMNDSIEERMVALQDSKAALGKGSLEKLQPEEKRKARLTALRDLFQVEDVEESWS
jgi:SWI/SNF-related matrix-associated actin-dependent regulator of chromatin subfamily A3